MTCMTSSAHIANILTGIGHIEASMQSFRHEVPAHIHAISRSGASATVVRIFAAINPNQSHRWPAGVVFLLCVYRPIIDAIRHLTGRSS